MSPKASHLAEFGDGAQITDWDGLFARRDQECEQFLATFGPLEGDLRALVFQLLQASYPEQEEPQAIVEFARWLLTSRDELQFFKRHAFGCLVLRGEQGVEFQEHPTRADAVGLPLHRIRLVDGIFIPSDKAGVHQPVEGLAPEVSVGAHAAQAGVEAAGGKGQ